MVDHAVWQYLQGTVVLSQLPVTLRCMIVQQATEQTLKACLGHTLWATRLALHMPS